MNYFINTSHQSMKKLWSSKRITNRRKKNVIATFGTWLAIMFACAWCFVKCNKRPIGTFLAAFGHVADIIGVKSPWKGNDHIYFKFKHFSQKQTMSTLTATSDYVSGQSQFTQPIQRVNRYCKQIHVAGIIRGKTNARDSILVLVLNSIGWQSGGSSFRLNAWCDDAKRKQMRITFDLQVKTDLRSPSISRSHFKIILFDAHYSVDIFPLRFDKSTSISIGRSTFSNSSYDTARVALWF